MALLQDSTYGLIREAEAKAGVPVEVRTDPKLGTLATIRYSRAAGLPHAIIVSPRGERTADYLVAFQCGFLLRMLELPTSEQRLFAATTQASKSVDRLLSSASFRRLPATQLATIRDQLTDGLLTQLRSMPIGMRVDRWIYDEFSNLADQQRASVRQQLNENAQALSPQVLGSFPAGISDRSAAMSIAQAQFWTDLTGEQEYVRPYIQRPQYARAKELIASIRDIPATPDHDYALVDDWARKLEMTGWYQWIPYS